MFGDGKHAGDVGDLGMKRKGKQELSTKPRKGNACTKRRKRSSRVGFYAVAPESLRTVYTNNIAIGKHTDEGAVVVVRLLEDKRRSVRRRDFLGDRRW